MSDAICKAPTGLADYLKVQNGQIEQIVNLVRGKLESGSRITLEALTTIDVHARDVVAQLNDSKVSSTNSFDWLSQLRYYWINGDCTVSMITTDRRYGYEYLGALHYYFRTMRKYIKVFYSM